MNINKDNWTFSQFNSKPLKAFISLGASPVESDTGLLEIQYEYLVTMTDEEYQELYQSSHEHLDDAIKVINDKYGHWELKDSSSKVSGEGCSSCAAH